MAKSQQITKLLKLCEEKWVEAGYFPSTVAEFKSIVKSDISSYMKEMGLEKFDSDVGIRYLESRKGLKRWQRLCHCVDFLNAALENPDVPFVKRNIQLRTYDLYGEIGEIAQKLVGLKRKERVTPVTLTVYRRVLSEFNLSLHLKGIDKISELTELHVMEFLSSLKNNQSQRLFVIRAFCKYLYHEGYVKFELGTFLEGVRSPQREKIPSVYTAQEIEQIGNAINRSSYNGRRNYAIFLLASRLGLRVSDIIRLRFSDVDWDKNIIRIVQWKTKRENILPLLSDIGNAIIDYLQAERPTTGDDHIFVSSRPPYTRICRDTVWSAMQEAIRASGVNVRRRHHGIHAMRHSLATELLENGTPLPIISSALGHASTASTSNYLKVDMNRLRSILLQPPPVPNDFYLQKGGIFYE